METGKVTYVPHRAFCALDSHEPPRATWWGTIYRYTNAHGEPAVEIRDVEVEFKDAYKAFYLIDDGETVVPHYVAGYNPTDRPGSVFLHPFPTNPGGERKRADRDEPVDYSNWHLGPRRAYHIKVGAAGPPETIES
jgi:hypothetical protein